MNYFKLLIKIFLSVATLLLLIGCGGSSDSSDTTSEIPNSQFTSAAVVLPTDDANISQLVSDICGVASGFALYTGFDTNENNILDESEYVGNPQIICNGAQGLQGENGIQGIQGEDGIQGIQGEPGLDSQDYSGQITELENRLDIVLSKFTDTTIYFDENIYTEGCSNGIDDDMDGSIDCDDSNCVSFEGCDSNTSSMCTIVLSAIATETNYIYDSGLDSIIVNAPAEHGTVPVDIGIWNAMITAIEYTPIGANPRRFWLADANVAVEVYLLTETGIEIAVGDLVSFTVEEITNYYGAIQISVISQLDVVAGENPIYIQDGFGKTDFTEANDKNKIFSIYGKIAVDDGACGSSYCYQIVHGENLEATIPIRTPDVIDVTTNQYINIIAPLGIIDGSVGFDIHNTDWRCLYLEN